LTVARMPAASSSARLWSASVSKTRSFRFDSGQTVSAMRSRASRATSAAS